MIVDAEIGTVPLDLGQWECHLWEEDADDLALNHDPDSNLPKLDPKDPFLGDPSSSSAPHTNGGSSNHTSPRAMLRKTEYISREGVQRSQAVQETSVLSTIILVTYSTWLSLSIKLEGEQTRNRRRMDTWRTWTKAGMDGSSRGGLNSDSQELLNGWLMIKVVLIRNNPAFIPSLTTSSRHFITFTYQLASSNPSASTGPSLSPPLLPLQLSPASVQRRFPIWSGLRHLRLWSVVSVGIFHVLSSKARVSWKCLSSFV
ncbi:hypothetical protein AX14_005494 [Amanita brunnescens Koide BX004]|nr:hypothetical protein AX14_005494 [Amanita brunnescens Koide BX004]